MDNKRHLFCLLSLSLLPLCAAAQEWSRKDSLKLREILESDQDIKINRNLVDEIEHTLHQQPKSLTEFDPTLPTLSPTYQTIHIPSVNNNLIPQLHSTYLPTYAWIKSGNNLFLQSKSNFSENREYFQIHTTVEYKLSNRWSLNVYGMQNTDKRRYRGLPSEVEPSVLGTNISFKINKHWKIKTGMQYQHNSILRKWEFIPQTSITYEW